MCRDFVPCCQNRRGREELLLVCFAHCRLGRRSGLIWPKIDAYSESTGNASVPQTDWATCSLKMSSTSEGCRERLFH